MFMWQEFAQAICLVLIIEGIVPFLFPARWRRIVTQLAMVTNTQLRMIGFTSMALGALALFVVKI